MRNCTVTRPVASRATGVLGQVRRCNRRTFASRLVIAGVDPGNGSSTHAKVAELADAPDLGSGGATRGGSSPPFRTNHLGPILNRPFSDCAQFCAHLAFHCAYFPAAC